MADLVYPSGGMRSRSSQRISTAMLPYASDPLGRRTIGASSIKGPELRQFAFVDDSFNGNAGAVGDAGRVMDGAITSGQNTLTTAAPIRNGHAVEIIGAGTVTSKNPSGNLVGWASVSSGVISLVTTQGGSTPLNASANVTNATVTYGTLDTAAVQSPTDALGGNGGGQVHFSPAKTYLLSHIIPNNGVTYTGPATIYIWAENGGGAGQSANDQFAFIYRPAFGYGGFNANVSNVTNPTVLTNVAAPTLAGVDPFAGLYVGLPLSGVNIAAGATVQSWNESAQTITMTLPATGVGTGQNVIRVVGNVTFQGLTFPGHGSEQKTQSVFYLAQITGVRIYDCTITNNAAGAISLLDAANLRIENNHLNNVTFGGSGFNAIDVQLGSNSATNPTWDFSVAFNTVLNPNQNRAETIAIVDEVTGGANTLPLDGRVIGNFVQGAIWVETGSRIQATAQQEIIVANNVCDAWHPITAMEVINDSVNENINPLSNSYIVVQGNILTGWTGLITSGSYMTVIGNVVNCLGLIGIWCESTSGQITVTGTATNGSPNIMSVADFVESTTVNGASQIFPTGTLTVASTTGFLSAGNILIAGVTGVVAYTGITPTTFTGCTGGTGTATNGGNVADANSYYQTVGNNWQITQAAQSTTVNGAGQTEPTGTLTVASTSGFPTAGTITIAGVTGTVAYTGITPTTFTGCTGGTGTATNSGAVALVVGGLTGGTYLNRGEGTTGWTVSQNFTGPTATGVVFIASVPSIGMVVSGNTIHMPADTGQVTDGMHILSFLRGSITGNIIQFDSGSSGSATGVGVTMAGCSETDFKSNRIDYAPTHGLNVSRSNDLAVVANTVRNASEITGSQGMRFTNITGTSLISSNQILDARSTVRTANSIGFATLAGGANSGVDLIGNELRGMTGNPINTFTGVTRMAANVIDTLANWPLAATAVTGALPFSIVNSSPWQQQITLAGGSAVAVGFQVGASGGSVAISPSAGIGTSTSMHVVMLEPGDQLNLSGTTVPANMTATPMIY